MKIIKFLINLRNYSWLTFNIGWWIIILLFVFKNNLKSLYLKLYIKLNIILTKIKIIYLYFIRIIYIWSAGSWSIIILPILSSIFFQYCLIKKLYYWILKIKYIINNIDLFIDKINEYINYISYNIFIILLSIIFFLLIILLLKLIVSNLKKNKIISIIITIFKIFLKKSVLIKIILNYNEELNLINKEMLNYKDNSSLFSNSSSSYSNLKKATEEDIDFDTDSELIEIETDKHKELMKPIEFKNFNDLTQEEQSKYIYQKMYNKAIEPNQPLIDWLITSTLNNTNGSKLEIDAYINSNLNIIQKEERDSQLMTHAFERTRPYPIKKIDPSPYAFPAYMSMKRHMDEWESQELIDAMNETKDIQEYMNKGNIIEENSISAKAKHTDQLLEKKNNKKNN
jgi:hypothetical protein